MTKYRNDVYQDKNGIWWARVNGKRKTGNTPREAHRLYKEMLDDAQRAAIARHDPDAIRANAEVVVLRGAPGSGKTTWAQAFLAEHRNYKRVSRDALRQMLDDGVYNTRNEAFIRKIRRQLIHDCLDEGYSVIVDDTNLSDRDMRDIHTAAYVSFKPRGVFELVPIPIRVVDMLATLGECIERDASRATPIGAERITELYRKWEQIKEWEKDD